MMEDLGYRILVADIDPQANLTSLYLGDEREERLREEEVHPTIYTAVEPQIKGTGDIDLPQIFFAAKGLGLVFGDLRLSSYEDILSAEWPKSYKKRINRMPETYHQYVLEETKAPPSFEEDSAG